MANRIEFKMTTAERRQRHFSENFKRQKVRELEIGISQVCDLTRQYEVSTTSIYRWISKFGSMKQKKERLIVEGDSDTKELLALKKKIAELERIIGQKQLLIDFKDKLIDIAEEMYQVDIKKKLGNTPFDGTGITEKP
jgi:transposase-like protein